MKTRSPRILLLDIETSPILAYVWSLWDQNVGLNQIKSDWHILSWAAKWYKEPKIIYQDQSKVKNIENDKKLMMSIWKLLDKADIVVTQNGKNFDHKKLNARFILNGLKPPSPYKIVDTYLIAKQKFAFTSNKLEYLSSNLTPNKKKLTDKERKFTGFDLWRQCILGNKKAWTEMKRYNIQDVIALEAIFDKLLPWHNQINLNLYNDELDELCNSCGSDNIIRHGHAFTSAGKYQRYRCNNCGHTMRDKVNLLNSDKKRTLKVDVK